MRHVSITDYHYRNLYPNGIGGYKHNAAHGRKEYSFTNDFNSAELNGAKIDFQRLQIDGEIPLLTAREEFTEDNVMRFLGYPSSFSRRHFSSSNPDRFGLCYDFGDDERSYLWSLKLPLQKAFNSRFSGDNNCDAIALDLIFRGYKENRNSTDYFNWVNEDLRLAHDHNGEEYLVVHLPDQFENVIFAIDKQGKLYKVNELSPD